jgi:hypothetical protein
MRAIMAEPLKSMLLKKVNPKVGRNGIKTATMNDARSTKGAKPCQKIKLTKNAPAYIA